MLIGYIITSIDRLQYIYENVQYRKIRYLYIQVKKGVEITPAIYKYYYRLKNFIVLIVGTVMIVYNFRKI